MGIQDNPLYVQVKQYALNNNLTSEQIRIATKTQMATVLNRGEREKFWDGNNEGFFTALRDNLYFELKGKEKDAIVNMLKNILLQVDWFKDNFPNADFDKGEERERDYIKIWLNGRPLPETGGL
jgi:hypothetical protein